MFRIAVVGLGPMGKRHIHAAMKIPHCEVVGLVDKNEKAVRDAIDLLGLQSNIAYSSHLEMLERAKPDIVVIATNGPSHYSLFKDTVNAGVKKVLCEKPFAVSLSEGYEMLRLAEEHSIQLLVNHVLRWSDDYALLKKQLQSGVIGDVQSFSYTMGGGQMACNGTHLMDLICYLTDRKIASVTGYLTDTGIPNPRGEHFRDPGGYALLHLENGVRVFFEMTEDLGIPPVLTINGKYGRVTIDEIKGYMLFEGRSEQDRQLPVTRYFTSLSQVAKYEYTEHDIVTLTAKAIQMLVDGEPRVHPKESLHAVEAIIAIHHSHESGNTRVFLPLTDEEIVNRKFSFT